MSNLKLVTPCGSPCWEFLHNLYFYSLLTLSKNTHLPESTHSKIIKQCVCTCLLFQLYTFFQIYNTFKNEKLKWMNNDFVRENVHTRYCVIIIVVSLTFVILLEFLKTVWLWLSLVIILKMNHRFWTTFSMKVIEWIIICL